MEKRRIKRSKMKEIGEKNNAPEIALRGVGRTASIQTVRT